MQPVVVYTLLCKAACHRFRFVTLSVLERYQHRMMAVRGDRQHLQEYQAARGDRERGGDGCIPQEQNTHQLNGETGHCISDRKNARRGCAQIVHAFSICGFHVLEIS